jgi:hypothetical protein
MTRLSLPIKDSWIDQSKLLKNPRSSTSVKNVYGKLKAGMFDGLLK